MAEEIEKLDPNSLDLAEDKKQQLKQLFPEIFSEDQIDFEKLKLILGEDAAAGSERYELSWAGKYEAFKEIQKQTTATLIPDRDGSVNFDTTENIFIEGENLEVLRVLQKSYYGKIKMIYIDPPYNTGNDHFVYPDDFAERIEEYQKRSGIKDEKGFLNKQDLWKKNTKENGQFHSVWLSMMYPRLYLAKNLLKEDGLIFISIDENEQANLKLLCDLVFGGENLINTLVWKKSYGGGAKSKYVVNLHEYVLIYAKNISKVERLELPPSEDVLKYYKYKDDKFPVRGPYRTQPLSTNSMDDRPNLQYSIQWEGNEIWPEKQWQWSKERVEKALANDELVISNKSGKWVVDYKQYLKDEEGNVRSSKPYSVLIGPYTQIGTNEISDLFGNGKVFPFPKPSTLLREFVLYADDDAICMDFFSGSATLAHAVLDLNFEDGGNRKFLLVQMPEQTEEGSEAKKAGYDTISSVAKARIQKVMARIQTELEEKAKKPELFKNEDQPQDLGLKSFRLSHSNFKTWRPDTTGKDAIIEQLDVFQDSLKETAAQEALVYELLLKAGRSLTAKIEARSVEHEGEETPYYLVEDGQLLFALDAINASLIQEILNLKPKAVIVLDSLFKGDDAFMTNTHLQLKEADIDFKVI